MKIAIFINFQKIFQILENLTLIFHTINFDYINKITFNESLSNLSIKINSGSIDIKIIEKLNKKILSCKKLTNFSIEINKECEFYDNITKIFKDFSLLIDLRKLTIKISLKGENINLNFFESECIKLNLIAFNLDLSVSKEFRHNIHEIFKFQQISEFWGNFKVIIKYFINFYFI